MPQSLIGKAAKLNNVNPRLYKWRRYGVISWASDSFVQMNNEAPIYSHSSITVLDGDLESLSPAVRIIFEKGVV